VANPLARAESVSTVPPSVTELVEADARPEVEAKPTDDATPAHPLEVKPKARRRRPPKPSVPKAADGAPPVPQVSADQMPALVKRLLIGDLEPIIARRR
jgi:hypothetical protein